MCLKERENVPLGYTPGGHRRPIDFKKSLRRTSSKLRKKGGVQKILPSKKNLLQYTIIVEDIHIVKSSRKIFLTSDNVLFKERKYPRRALVYTPEVGGVPLTSTSKSLCEELNKTSQSGHKTRGLAPAKEPLALFNIAELVYIVK